MAEKCENLISRLHSDGTSWLTAFDWMTNLVAMVLDHALGLLAAALTGLLAGHRIGRIYASQVEPLYVQDLRELATWQVIPHTFARSGAVLGALVGLLLILVLHRKFLAEKVISRIRTSPADPSQMTRTGEAGNERSPRIPGGSARNESLSQEKGRQR